MNRILFSSKSDHWSTPREVYDALASEFRFDFDPCPLHSTDGLTREWRGRVFCNPPYSDVKGFIAKGLRHLDRGDCEVLVYLLPSRTGTAAVLPDVVAGGRASFEFSIGWLPRLEQSCPRWLLALQDGMDEADVASLPPELGLFLGGSTEWKVASIERFARVAHAQGRYYHVGRVNSRRRFVACQGAGADSVDGSSVSRFSVNAERVAAWVSQYALTFRDKIQLATQSGLEGRISAAGADVQMGDAPSSASAGYNQARGPR